MIHSVASYQTLFHTQLGLNVTKAAGNSASDRKLCLVKSHSLLRGLQMSFCVLLMDTSTLPVTVAEIAKATKRDNTLAIVLQIRHGHWPESRDENLAPFM